MDKLFNYSKIVSCIALISTLLCVASLCSQNYILSYAGVGFGFALRLSILIWFGIIATKSVKGNSLKLLSIMGAIFSLITLISSIIPNMVHFEDMNEPSYIFVDYLYIISGLGLGVVFILLSKFFNKKPINTLALALGVLLLLNNIGYMIIDMFYIITAMLIILNIIIYILYSVFFFLFSKLNK